jgi:hypothetical protein
MLSHLHPTLHQLPPSFRGALDLLTGFVLVYLLRCLSTVYSRWRLIRSHSEKLSVPAPVLKLRDVPGPHPPSWLWGSEWEMYNSPPGQKYLEWYNQFGRIVKFNGVLGVSSLLNPISHHAHMRIYPVYLSLVG